MVGGLWSALFYSCFLGVCVPSCWTGLSPEQRDGVLESSSLLSCFPAGGTGASLVCQGLYVTSHPNGSPCQASCGPH